MPSNAVVAASHLAGHLAGWDPSTGTGLVRTFKVRSRAPLRLGLAGGGTDVSPYCELFGGLVLNATIGRYCHATLERRADDRGEFVAPDLERPSGPEAGGAPGLALHAAGEP